MRYIGENYKTINESDVDLSKGSIQKIVVIKEDATPIDNITKFAWYDDDYEEVYLYTLNEVPEIYPQDDTDLMLIDLEYRLSLLELGLEV